MAFRERATPTVTVTATAIVVGCDHIPTASQNFITNIDYIATNAPDGVLLCCVCHWLAANACEPVGES